MLEKEFEFNKARKLKYKQDHLDLENDQYTAVLTLDFFGTHTNPEAKVQDCVCVFASKNDLNVPLSLLEEQITPVEPISRMPEEVANLVVSKKKAGLKKPKPEPERKRVRSVKDVKKLEAKKRFLPAVSVADGQRFVHSFFHVFLILLSGAQTCILPLHRNERLGWKYC